MTKWILALIPSIALAAPSTHKISCQFGEVHPDPGFIIEGTLKGQDLSIKSFNDLDGEVVLEQDDINSIETKVLASGHTSFVIDALSDDPDYGWIYEIELESALRPGTAKATIVSTYFSRNDGTPDEPIDGTCVVK
jgi:hypothetical protein